MSTIPGHESWRDASLEGPEATDLPEIEPDDEELDQGAYVPADPRPDLDGTANHADVAEQLAEVPEDESEAYPG
ncbi:hypothetical protein [Cellulomonas denverensis]|uniref:hypothetical protein n=1 Tax=Cellulomonas denverensis TaxID=264297 RepID=UPI0035F089A6